MIIIAARGDFESENNELYCQIEDLKTKVNEFKMLYFETLKYKEQVDDLMKKGTVKKNNDEIKHF